MNYSGRNSCIRRAASKASLNVAAQLMDESDDESPPRRKGGGSSARKYPEHGIPNSTSKPKSSTHRSKGSFSEYAGGSQSAVRPRPRPISKVKQNPTPSKLESPFDDDSDLSPLSSPLCSPECATKPLPELPQQPLSSKISNLPTRHIPSTSMALPGRPPRDDGWDRMKLGTYVWVLIDKRARVLDSEDLTETDGRRIERIWWPGKIKSRLSETPIQVQLFGTAAPRVKTIEIHEACELNIQSLNDSLQRARFDSPTFLTSPLIDSENLEGSPQKKRKYDRGDLEERWRLAVMELAEQRKAEEDSDSLPEVGTLEFKYAPSSGVNLTTRVTGKWSEKQDEELHQRAEGDGDMDSEMEILGSISVGRWSPPPADDSLTIPGELVFARESLNKPHYWPAKILEYIPPTKRSQQGKYLVEYLDEVTATIPRNLFYSTDEDEFATCMLGKWDSEFHDVLNDDDNETPLRENHKRMPSPFPSDPPPSCADFLRLDIRQQFVYTKPILRAILNEEYLPAKRKHKLFIGGGRGKDSVVDEAGLRGKMDPKDVRDLQEYLLDWCLRDDRRAKIIADDEAQSILHDVIPVDIPMPRSSPSDTEPASASSPVNEPPSSFSFIEDIEKCSTNSAPTSNLPMAENTDETLLSTDGEDNVSLPRQRGCDAFEALTPMEKGDYCLNVLLPEAILQILLWRTGARTSMELLSEEEEEELHKQGDVLINERDWVHDVMRLRASKSRRLKRTLSTSKTSLDGGLTVTGRPKRNIGAPRSYQE